MRPGAGRPPRAEVSDTGRVVTDPMGANRWAGGPDCPESLRRVRFAPVVRLSKEEVFAACQALADADRCLVTSRTPP